ncbi:MAG: hypothetical protein P8179_16060 [Candidatus Thiodiazotropha sp.]
MTHPVGKYDHRSYFLRNQEPAISRYMPSMPYRLADLLPNTA